MNTELDAALSYFVRLAKALHQPCNEKDCDICYEIGCADGLLEESAQTLV